MGHLIMSLLILHCSQEEERIRVAHEIEEEVEELLRAEEEARVHNDYCMAVIIDTVGTSVASH